MEKRFHHRLQVYVEMDWVKSSTVAFVKLFSISGFRKNLLTLFPPPIKTFSLSITFLSINTLISLGSPRGLIPPYIWFVIDSASSLDAKLIFFAFNKLFTLWFTSNLLEPSTQNKAKNSSGFLDFNNIALHESSILKPVSYTHLRAHET